MCRARLLRDWNGKKAGDELDVSPRWLDFAKRQGLAEEIPSITKKKKTTADKTASADEPQSEKED